MVLSDQLTMNAKLHPDRSAVVHAGTRMSYAALDLLSELMALHLARQGVRKGDRVALLLDNSPEYVVTYFGIMKAGAVVVPLNTQMVARELRLLLADCTPALLVADRKRAALAAEAVTALSHPLPVLPADKWVRRIIRTFGRGDFGAKQRNFFRRVAKATLEKNSEGAAQKPPARREARFWPASSSRVAYVAQRLRRAPCFSNPAQTRASKCADNSADPLIPALSGCLPMHRPAVKIAETDLAAILYTSGTTGKPKGVMLSHGNITANACSIIASLGLTAKDSVLALLPFSYSYGASLLTTHIMAGGTLVVDNRFLYPNAVLEAMENEGVTGFAGVPSHFTLLLRNSALRNFRLPKLRYVTQAGGPMSPALIKEFAETVPHAKFFVMYGQTEATARLGCLAPEYLSAKPGSIGKAIPGVELAVLNERGEETKPGEIGEIVARGGNIMMGYWNAPAETRRVLRNGALHTGDLATRDGDGFLYIAGRRTDMIKSGAHRISPREIEDAVCLLPGVLECAAVGIPDGILGEAVKLFVVKAGGSALTEQDIRVFCRLNLAPCRNPKIIELVPSLPRTASGKVKREELKLAYAGAGCV